uniref:F-box domain-containing protein n=1 Tax=Caenorhabditis tropicalis TaxID=1561998 RepID=A0A1I7TJE7_9PELO
MLRLKSYFVLTVLAPASSEFTPVLNSPTSSSSIADQVEAIMGKATHAVIELLSRSFEDSYQLTSILASLVQSIATNGSAELSNAVSAAIPAIPILPAASNPISFPQDHAPASSEVTPVLNGPTSSSSIADQDAEIPDKDTRVVIEPLPGSPDNSNQETTGLPPSKKLCTKASLPIQSSALSVEPANKSTSNLTSISSKPKARKGCIPKELVPARKSHMKPQQLENFSLLKLPDLALLECMQQMDTVALCRFVDANDDVWEKKIRKQVSLGDVSLFICRSFSTIEIGNLEWTFHAIPPKIGLPKVTESLGPLTVEVMKLDCYKGDRWISEVEDASIHPVKLVKWMLQKFPKRNLLVCGVNLSENVNDQILDSIETVDVDKFKECTIIIPRECQEERVNKFFNDKIKRWEVNMIMTHNVKLAAMRNYGTSLVPNDIREWSLKFEEPDTFCQYLILRNVHINEDFLNSTINKWINLKYRKLVLVRVQYLDTLDKEKILSEIDTKEFNKEEFNRHKNHRLFAPYTGENPLVVENKHFNKATIWIDEENKTFMLAIWDTKAESRAIEMITSF